MAGREEGEEKGVDCDERIRGGEGDVKREGGG
jgi:hypothetical protein